MPTDPAIKAALEAAARQLCFGHEGADCDRCVDPVHCTGSAWMRPGLAAAIAAFLRAPGMDGLLGGAHAVAAAIEAAAKEDRT